MEACDKFRKWEELIPDALGLIFKNLTLLEMLTVVPRVCKSWGKVVKGPYCWQEIDIEEWSKGCKPETLDRMLEMLITRSCGSLRKLAVSSLSNDQSFLFIEKHAQSLRALRLPRCEITDPIMARAATSLSSLTSLDLSYCIRVGARGLEAVGRACRSLTSLRRVMHPLEVVGKPSQDDEALAVAATMPRLRHLEIAYLLVRTHSVVEIIKNCKDLELLDVRGCWDVNLEEGFLKGFMGLRVMGPVVVDCYDVCSEFSGSSGYLAWDFVAGEGLNGDDDEDDDDDWYGYDDDDDDDDVYGGMMGHDDDDGGSMEDVEMWFYDDVDAVDAGYDWPQSP
ncbi:F-box protein FBW2 [Striga hermonthica]|uniref:F-box protein FBW2 n=1 Tax=Striga hermonthica TaxID=68872 RepID=A0A9N7NLM4_STRHE|nr:F-box protein FBW2 [Striga hermonthica]